jgi:phosphonate transport system permease protein
MGAIGGFLLAVFVAKSTRPNHILAIIIRSFATILRSIPLVAWAMIFLFSFGQSSLTGLLAIFIESLGFFIRAFSEAVDETAGSSIEALRASGASWSQTMAQSVLPSVTPQLISWTMYLIETNIRNATLVGILTGTGIGFTFNLYYGTFRYEPAALTVIMIILVVLLIEAISNKIRSAML